MTAPEVGPNERPTACAHGVATTQETNRRTIPTGFAWVVGMPELEAFTTMRFPKDLFEEMALAH